MERSPGANVVIGILALGVSWVLLGFGREAYDLARTTQQWYTTEGEILSGKVAERERSPRRLFDRRTRNERYTYSAQITYRYSVDGTVYYSNQISSSKRWSDYFGARGTSGAAAEASWLSLYPVGKKVIVYYDPADPESALLERDEYWLAYLSFGLAGLAGLVGLAFFNLARHGWQGSP